MLDGLEESRVVVCLEEVEVPLTDQVLKLNQILVDVSVIGLQDAAKALLCPVANRACVRIRVDKLENKW